jgi:hypothetical protein
VDIISFFSPRIIERESQSQSGGIIEAQLSRRNSIKPERERERERERIRRCKSVG